MKDLLVKSAKNLAAFFLVGVALAVVSVPVATAMGAAGLLTAATVSHVVGTSALWTGIFFGGFGALVPPAEKAVEMLFSMKKRPQALDDLMPENGNAVAGGPECGCNHVADLEAKRQNDRNSVRTV